MEAIVEPEPVAGAHPPDTCHGRRDNPATPHDRGGKAGQAMPGANLLELLFETSRIKGWIDSDLPRAVARQKRQNQEAPADPAHTSLYGSRCRGLPLVEGEVVLDWKLVR